MMPIDPKKIEELRSGHREFDRLMLRAAGTKATEAEVRAYHMTAATQAQAVPALLSERESLLSLLREVEWEATVWLDYDDTRESCPVCSGVRPDGLDEYDRKTIEDAKKHVGHAPDCRLAAFLKGS